MLPLERLWREQSRTPVLTISGAIILLVAAVDWWTKPYVSLGLLYLFPIMFAAGFLPRWLTALVAVACAVLAEVFSSLEPSWIRLGFEALALGGCGLFVGELVRNRRLALQTQERLKALVETSPAAIVTVGEKGFIEIANRAALELLAPASWRLNWLPDRGFPPGIAPCGAMGFSASIPGVHAMPGNARDWGYLHRRPMVLHLSRRAISPSGRNYCGCERGRRDGAASGRP